MNSKRKLIELSFFISFTIIALVVFKDYGIGWDEGACIRNGLTSALEINKFFNYKLISKEKATEMVNKTGEASKIGNLENFNDKDYGSLNEIILTSPAFIFKKLNDTRFVILTRHLMIHFIFLLSAFCLYRALCLIDDKFLINLFLTSFYILTPRLYGDSFYNSKDIVFLSSMMITIYFMFRYFNSTTRLNIVLFSIFIGLSISIRIPGLYLMPFMLVLVWYFKYYKERCSILELLTHYSILSVATISSVIVLWPTLWTNPFGNFITSFLNMAKFRYSLDMLFKGEIISSQNIPSLYVPEWLLISIPLPLIACFICGVICLCIYYKEIENRQMVYYVLSIALFVTPIVIVIALKSVLYDAWRQMFFIYPGFIIIMQLFFSRISQYKYNIVNYLLSMILVSLAYINFIYHPYQTVYFNMLTSHNASEKYDFDYWGVSYKESLEYLINRFPNDTLYIYEGEFSPVKASKRMIESNKQQFLKFTKLDSADYIISSYKECFYKKDIFMKRYSLSSQDEIYSINRDNKMILSIYKVSKDNPRKIDTTLNDFFMLERSKKRQLQLNKKS